MAANTPAPPTGAVTVVTQTRVRANHADDFSRWQQQVNDVIAQAPGFIDHEVLPPTAEQPDWVIIQRFTGVAAARNWLGSDARAALVAQAMPWLVGHDDVHLIQADEAPATAPISVVISTRVKPGEEAAFQAWQRRIAAVEAEFPGYQGYKLAPPIPGVQDDWVTIIRFDSEPHLQAWLDSPKRQELVRQSEAFTTDTHLRTVRTGFDAWFKLGNGGTAPPAWKQNMLVVLALYPVVFLFGHLVQTPVLMERWGLPFWLALFVGNVVGVLLLGVIVPWVSRRFAWWINPTGDPRRANTIGIVVIVALYGLFLLLFSQVR